MKKGQIYNHYKNNPYKFLGVALPYNETFLKNEDNKKSIMGFDAELSTDKVILGIEVIQVGDFYLTSKKEPQVIYEALKEGVKEKIWVRPFDDFFSTVEVDGEVVDRFTLVK